MKKKNVFAPLTGVASKTRNVSPTKHSAHERWIFGVLPADDDAPTVEDEKSPGGYYVLFGFALVILLALLGRSFWLQIVKGKSSLTEAQQNRFMVDIIRAPRGLFYDRNLVPLVKNIPNYEMTVIPSDLPANGNGRNEVYQKVAGLVGMTPAAIQKIAESKEAGHKINPNNSLSYTQPIVVVKSVTRDVDLLFESRQAELTGFSVDINPIREYDDSGLLSQVFGYVGRIDAEEYKTHSGYQLTDFIGKMGLEKSYEKVLRGIAGMDRVERDSGGKVIQTYSQQEPVPGSNLQLAIDFNLEQKIASELSKQLAAAKVTRGAAVAVNPQNGEILAMVSLPTYDNNLFAKGISDADYQKLLASKDKPLINKVTSGEYPSGSIIKPFIAAAGLQEGNININSTVNSTGGIKVGTYTFPDWEAHGAGVTNVVKALAQSVNTFFYAVGGGYENIKGLGPDVMKKYLNAFGFGKTVPLDIDGQSKGNIPDPAWKEAVLHTPWYLGDTYHMSIGQGDVLITPIQMANALQIIANGSTMYKLHFVKALLDSNGKVVSQVSPQVVETSPVSASALDIVRQGMLACVTSGSCGTLRDLPVQAAGKTGTAQFGANNEFENAWFTCFAPYNNPQIEMVILLDSGGEGSTYAEPVANNVLKWYFNGEK